MTRFFGSINSPGQFASFCFSSYVLPESFRRVVDSVRTHTIIARVISRDDMSAIHQGLLLLACQHDETYLRYGKGGTLHCR